MEKEKKKQPSARDMVPLEKRWTLNRVELAHITGRSTVIVDQWVHEGIPCWKQGRLVFFEKETALAWLKKKALSRQGLYKKSTGFDDIFPGIELA